MHTLHSRIADEVDYFGEPDIELTTKRTYCSECKRRTVHTYRMGYLECAEHSLDDSALEALEV
jgi:hypothetical protein